MFKKTRADLIILSLTTALAIPAYSQSIRDWDTTIHNDTDYSLEDVKHTKDEKGYVEQLVTDQILPRDKQLAFNLKANYIGQLSQDFTFTVKENGLNVGTCNFHAGLGSYWTYPDFSGSKCELKSGKTLSVLPRYRIKSENFYDVLYTVGQLKSFTRIYVFGDSLSDNGNLYKLDGGLIPKSPPYYHGQFSNGPIWIEQLMNNINLSTDRVLNFAYGYAMSGSEPKIIPTFLRQVLNYTISHPTGDPFAIYTVWIGANDFLEGSNDIDGDTNLTLENLANGIKQLAEHGAKTFLVLNMPDLGITPKASARDKNNGNDNFSTSLTKIANTYNEKISELLPKLEREYNISIIPFDASAQLKQVIDTPEVYDFKNSSDPCSLNDYGESGKFVCKKPYEYVFWDNVHPTAHVHELLGDKVFAILSEYGYKPAPDFLLVGNS